MTILRIDSSITGENSVSRKLTDRIIDQLRTAHPGERIIERDLASDPLPHLTLADLGDPTVVDEFLAADTVVIGAPMYNWNIPSQLKAWMDRILVAGRTFKYTESGPVGLAGGKRVIIALARGGFYEEGSAVRPLEHVETYLAAVFRVIGITPEFVRADGIAVGPEQRQHALTGAMAEVDRLAA